VGGGGSIRRRGVSVPESNQPINFDADVDVAAHFSGIGRKQWVGTGDHRAMRKGGIKFAVPIVPDPGAGMEYEKL